eukprot:3938957-Rhodomonas_salina.2
MLATTTLGSATGKAVVRRHQPSSPASLLLSQTRATRVELSSMHVTLPTCPDPRPQTPDPRPQTPDPRPSTFDPDSLATTQSRVQALTRCRGGWCAGPRASRETPPPRASAATCEPASRSRSCASSRGALRAPRDSA